MSNLEKLNASDLTSTLINMLVGEVVLDKTKIVIVEIPMPNLKAFSGRRIGKHFFSKLTKKLDKASKKQPNIGTVSFVNSNKELFSMVLNRNIDNHKVCFTTQNLVVRSEGRPVLEYRVTTGDVVTTEEVVKIPL